MAKPAVLTLDAHAKNERATHPFFFLPMASAIYSENTWAPFLAMPRIAHLSIAELALHDTKHMLDSTISGAVCTAPHIRASAIRRCIPRRRGQSWYFGMKAHVGVDASSGLVHTAGVTSSNVHDAKVMDRLVRNDDTAVYGDKG